MYRIHRYLMAGCVLSSSFLLLVAPSVAQRSLQQCRATIQSSIRTLQNTPDLSITRESKFYRGVNYPDRKARRSSGYMFVMQGNGVDDIFSSSQLMLNIAQNVIGGCSQVAQVTFARSGSGENVVFGLFPDGQVKPFKCAEDFGIDPYSNNTKLEWGMQFCSI